MTRAALLALACIAVLPAQAAAPSREDRAEIEACLARAADNAKKAAPRKDELDEAPGAEGRLAAAAGNAAQEPSSCVGVLAKTCIKKAGNTSNAVLNECYEREAAVWDSRLNASYRAALARIDKPAADNLRKTQRAWTAWRDAACRQPDVTFKGTMAGPMAAWCAMDLTARQALWMAGWAE
ncbi:MAG: lysozyme inhibitor LprI family protein [Methylocystis sp.]|uniref:lysozyme inhibitor LprI family protein n=1 Tax=Methylocystis sp. TaxID=1911079 RepID=UPI003D1306E7